MNIDDITKAAKAKERINFNRKAIENITGFLTKNIGGDCDGSSFSGEQKIYSLRIGEYSDDSGFSADLTASMIQTQVLECTISLLGEQLAKDLAFIESL